MVFDMDNSRVGSPKFTCYFCNKTIENETEMGHTAVCGNVLVPCPHKCGSYIPRMELQKHRRECLNRITRSMPRLPSLNEDFHNGTQEVPSSTGSLGRNVNGHPQRTGSSDPKIGEEIHRLSKKFADFEKHYFQNQQKVPLQNFIPSLEGLKNHQQQQALEIEKVKYQTKVTQDWKKNVETQMYNLKQSLAVFQNSKKETELHWLKLQDRLMMLDKIQLDLNYLRDSFFKEQALSRQASSSLHQDFDTFRHAVDKENATVAAVFNDHKLAIENLRQDMESIRNLFDEQKSKFTNLVFDLRAASQIASEAAERVEIQERDFSEIKKEINQMKLDLEILEGLSASHDNGVSCGRLIWKVTELEAKMQRARDFDSVLKSPVFYTHEYGYKIRVLLYLNGLKKWKDRYALLCIHVLKGDYDMLLKWPCHIEATITLRDLENVEKPKPFTKYITAKRQSGDEENEEPQESSSSFIFIPHSTLLKQSFVKEDTLFIDVKIQQNTKLETSL